MAYIHIDTGDILGECEDDELKAELESRGYVVIGNGHSLSEMDGLERIRHLSLCGLKDAARTEALQLVGQAIGRNLQ